MFSSWYSVALLAMESSSVVCLRMVRVAGGGSDARRETQLMFDEKIAANMEAAMTLMAGGTLDTVVGRYREQVAANTSRLMTAMFDNLPAGAAPAAAVNNPR